MLTYSIAIRTLGTAGDKFRQELESINCQTVKPEKVVVYIAEGYSLPDFKIGKEEYVPVKKGMMAQRALPYNEICSDVIFFLDDDVMLAPDSAGRMLQAMQEHHADAIGADVFRNHNLPLSTKLWAAVSNLVFPHFGNKWAFKIHKNGSFSYLNRPKRNFYWSQSCSGPAFMIKTDVYKNLHFEEELWLELLGYAYNEDTLETYKIYKNGFRLGVLFNSGCIHLDAKTGMYDKKKSIQKIRLRTKANYLIWHRAIFSVARGSEKLWIILCFITKLIFLLVGHIVYSIIKCNPDIIWNYVKGLQEGNNFVKSSEYRSLSSYVTKKS